MTREIFALFADYFAKPFFDFRIVDVVVVNPSLIASIVRRIDIDTLDSAFILGQQRLERLQIIAANNHVVAFVCVIGIFFLQHPIRDLLVVIDDFIFSDPFKRRHVLSPLALTIFGYTANSPSKRLFFSRSLRIRWQKTNDRCFCQTSMNLSKAPVQFVQKSYEFLSPSVVYSAILYSFINQKSKKVIQILHD